MLHYNPSQEPATERFFLVTLRPSEYGGWSHFNARVLRAAKPHGVDDGWNDDGDNAKGYRSATWSSGSKSAVYVEDLTVHAQMDIPKYIPYGSDIRFDKCGSIVDRSEAKRMAETFAKIDKGLAKIAESFGDLYSDDYCGLLLRVAEVLKIKKFLFYRDASDRRDLATAEFKVVSASNLKWELEKVLDSVRPKVAAETD